jgi:hypothetical protein
MMSDNTLMMLIEPILKSKSRKYKVSITTEEMEDIESQLWLHVFEQMPKFDNLSEGEIKALANTMLTNKAISIYRKHRTVMKHSIPISDEEDRVRIDSILCNEIGMIGMRIFDIGIHEYGQQTVLECKELYRIIEEWGESQDYLTRKLVTEMISPSDETLKKWEDMVTKHPVYKTYGYVPPCSYHKILGISRPKILKIMKSLRDYLFSVYESDICYKSL